MAEALVHGDPHDDPARRPGVVGLAGPVMEATILSLRKTVNRLRWAVLILSVALVLVGFVAPAAIIRYQEKQSDELACTIVRVGVNNANDLADIRRTLGLPGGPPIPEVPAECDGS